MGGWWYVRGREKQVIVLVMATVLFVSLSLAASLVVFLNRVSVSKECVCKSTESRVGHSGVGWGG